MLNLGDGGCEREIESGERRDTFYRHPMRFGRDLWGFGVVGVRMRRRRVCSAVGEGLGQPWWRGKGRGRSLAEGGECGRGESVGD
jgi:hypothetical protein